MSLVCVSPGCGLPIASGWFCPEHAPPYHKRTWTAGAGDDASDPRRALAEEYAGRDLEAVLFEAFPHGAAVLAENSDAVRLAKALAERDMQRSDDEEIERRIVAAELEGE